ncbi:MAG: aromatic amino acid transport family protein [Candidatus Tantalella remota]|nr:aromatic amino acid transport family protein [Candidatus Tantalella remota]
MKTQISFARIFTNALFVTGMTIGAGILGLPIKTGAAGILPSLVVMLVVWGFMMCTATIFIYKFTHPKERSRSYPVLFQSELKSVGKWVGTFGYLVIYYGLMVAYLTGSASILVNLVPFQLPINVWMTGFFVIFTLLSLLGAEKASKWNAAIMVILIASFSLLIVKTAPHIDVSRFARSDWNFTTSLFPIILVAFCFQNVIPFVCKNLGGNAKASFTAITLGSLIAIALNVVWMFAVIGSLQLDGPGKATIMYALQNNQPATIPLTAALHSSVITVTGLFFALVAIATSYVPTSLALTGFVRNTLSLYFKNVKNYVVFLFAFGPPFLVAMLFPHVFLAAIDVVGGLGIILIFGILPGLLLIKMALNKNKILVAVAIFILAASSLLLACEIAQEFSLLKLGPSIESWKTSFDDALGTASRVERKK